MDIFKHPWLLDHREFYVTASIGISVYPDDGSDLHELMKNADAAMYRAKETGRNNYQIYTPELNLRIMERLRIENHLRKATDRNEFVLYYQPQIDLKSGQVVCAGSTDQVVKSDLWPGLCRILSYKLQKKSD